MFENDFDYTYVFKDLSGSKREQRVITDIKKIVDITEYNGYYRVEYKNSKNITDCEWCSLDSPIFRYGANKFLKILIEKEKLAQADIEKYKEKKADIIYIKYLIFSLSMAILFLFLSVTSLIFLLPVSLTFFIATLALGAASIFEYKKNKINVNSKLMANYNYYHDKVEQLTTDENIGNDKVEELANLLNLSKSYVDERIKNKKYEKGSESEKNIHQVLNSVNYFFAKRKFDKNLKILKENANIKEPTVRREYERNRRGRYR